MSFFTMKMLSLSQNKKISYREINFSEDQFILW